MSRLPRALRGDYWIGAPDIPRLAVNITDVAWQLFASSWIVSAWLARCPRKRVEFLCGELQIHRASGHTPNPGTTQGTSCQGTLVALVFDRFGERVFLTSTNVNKRSTSASRFTGKNGKRR